MYIDYLQTFTLVAAACSCSRTRAGLSLSSLVHWRHKWKEKRETVYNLWKDSHLRPQKTTQTHSRHDNTTTSQISRTNLQTTPAHDSCSIHRGSIHGTDSIISEWKQKVTETRTENIQTHLIEIHLGETGKPKSASPGGGAVGRWRARRWIWERAMEDAS